MGGKAFKPALRDGAKLDNLLTHHFFVLLRHQPCALHLFCYSRPATIFREMLQGNMTDDELRKTAPDVRDLRRALNVEINLMWEPGARNANTCVTKVVSEYDPCQALATVVFAPGDPGRERFAFSSFLADPIVARSLPVPPTANDHLQRRRDLIAHGVAQAKKNRCGIVAFVVPEWEFPHMAKLLGGGKADTIATNETVPGVRAMLFNINRVKAFFPRVSATSPPDLRTTAERRRIEQYEGYPAAEAGFWPT